MAKKQVPVPSALTTFIKNGETTFHCDDGDWDLKIESRDKSDFKDELPARSVMIAENGSGDCLFLKTSAAGKIDSKVFVYWHEEERNEVFAKSIAELIATSAKNKAAEEKPKPAKASAGRIPLKDVEKQLSTQKGHLRWAVMREFNKSEFGLEALPLLRRLLAENDASMVILAAECIAKLGPEAATCPAGQAQQPIADAHVDQGDLLSQLSMRGSQVWNYSGYANSYSACLAALAQCGYEPDYLIEYVQMHVGIDLDASLEALRVIGTSEARELAKRALAFWLPELNMSETKRAKALVESIGKKKSTGKKK